MTIKIQAYQRHGRKTPEVIDEYEFCCWEALQKWINGFEALNVCPACESVKKGIVVGKKDYKMIQEKGYWQSFKTNHKKLTNREMIKALFIYTILNPFVWAIIICAFILGTQLK